jgi:hypothetical protein
MGTPMVARRARRRMTVRLICTQRGQGGACRAGSSGASSGQQPKPCKLLQASTWSVQCRENTGKAAHLAQQHLAADALHARRQRSHYRCQLCLGHSRCGWRRAAGQGHGCCRGTRRLKLVGMLMVQRRRRSSVHGRSTAPVCCSRGNASTRARALMAAAAKGAASCRGEPRRVGPPCIESMRRPLDKRSPGKRGAQRGRDGGARQCEHAQRPHCRRGQQVSRAKGRTAAREHAVPRGWGREGLCRNRNLTCGNARALGGFSSNQVANQRDRNAFEGWQPRGKAK